MTEKECNDKNSMQRSLQYHNLITTNKSYAMTLWTRAISQIWALIILFGGNRKKKQASRRNRSLRRKRYGNLIFHELRVYKKPVRNKLGIQLSGDSHLVTKSSTYPGTLSCSVTRNYSTEFSQSRS